MNSFGLFYNLVNNDFLKYGVFLIESAIIRP